MRNLIALVVICTFITIDTKSQDLLNPYDVTGHQGKLLIDWKYKSNVSNFEYIFQKAGTIPYNGEYQVYLRDHFWYFANIPSLQGKAFSMKIVALSFPFTLECTLTEFGCDALFPNGIPSPRDLVMPSVSYNPLFEGWEYPIFTIGPNQNPGQNILSNIKDHIPFTADWSEPAVLVSAGFVSGPAGAEATRFALPHTILKHTIYLHCGSDIINYQIVDSISWLYDNTRGRMRSYPFYPYNSSAGSYAYDVTYLPELVFPDMDYLYNTNNNYSWINGGSINQYPFNEITNNCSSIPTPSVNDYFHTLGGNFQTPFFPPYTIHSNFIRSEFGAYMAGFAQNTTSQSLDSTTKAGIPHQYFINENIELTLINSEERIIFNPSEVNVTANNLVFPSGYTFKTIRGLYASLADVALSIGVEGNYHDLRDVPVFTDLKGEDNNDLTNDNPPRAAKYYIKSGGKLTIEPCVTIYDATFLIESGGELVFQDRSSTFGRFQVFQQNGNGSYTFLNNNYDLIDEQGMVTRPVSLVPQGNTFLYESNDLIESGTAQQLPANLNLPVTIAPETHVVFVAENEIKLTPGFHAKADHSPSGQSVFHALIWPSHCAGSGNRFMASNNNSQTNYQPQKFLYPTNPVLQPNPSRNNSRLHFSVLEDSKVSVKLYNGMGQLVNTPLHQDMKEKGNHIVEIKTEGLQPGIYLCTLYTEVDGSKKPMQVSRKLVVE